MFVISKSLFIAFFNNLPNKTQLSNSRRGIEIFLGATFVFPHSKFTKISTTAPDNEENLGFTGSFLGFGTN